MTSATEPVSRCGFAAIIGAPNSGKSTLVNRLVGQKIAIVTHKVQTTRARLRGIAIEGLSQIVFVDTPGIFTPRRDLDRAMVEAAWSGAGDADLVILLVDSRAGLNAEVEAILATLGTARRPPVLALNKVDVVRPETLLGLSQRLNERLPFAATFMISALSGSGVEDLRRYAATAMPEGPWLYPEDQIADLPQRLLAAEITREKLTLRLHQELPYALTVETEGWAERPDGSVRIDQLVYVEREGQRKIVLGKDGQTIKAIGQAARKEIAEAIGHPVHLFLFVKVRENWASDPERLKMMGLE